MTVDEYVEMLKQKVSAELVEETKDWPVDTQLYIYLHNIQLDYMEKFMKRINGIANEINDPFRGFL